MWSYIVLNRDIIEFCVFEFKDNACEAVPILVENYVTAEFDNYTLSSIAHSFLNKNSAFMPQILTRDDVHRIELCGECVPQPQYMDFLSNPKKHVILEFVYHRNNQLVERAASDIIVLYTPQDKHQAVEIQRLFERYGFNNVVVVPEYLLFVDNNKRILKTTAMMILDVFESTLNMHVIDESRQYKNICAHDICIKTGIVHAMLADICMGYYGKNKMYMKGSEIADLRKQLESHFREPYVNREEWEIEWLDGGKKKKISFDKDPWESVYTELLPDFINPYLRDCNMKLEDMQRVMVVGYSAMAEDIVNATLNACSKAYPVQPDNNQFISSTLWEIIHHPESYAFLSNGRLIPSVFPSFRLQICDHDLLPLFPPSSKRESKSDAMEQNDKGMHWKKMEIQSHSSQLVTKYEDPFVFIFLYGKEPGSVGISMVLNRDYTPEDGRGYCYVESMLPKAFLRYAINKKISDADVTVGVVKDGQFEGKAIRQYIYTPICWEGRLIQHRPEGIGRVTFQDELVFEGMYHNGYISGQVYYHLLDSCSYRGLLVDDQLVGFGYELGDREERMMRRRKERKQVEGEYESTYGNGDKEENDGDGDGDVLFAINLDQERQIYEYQKGKKKRKLMCIDKAEENQSYLLYRKKDEQTEMVTVLSRDGSKETSRYLVNGEGNESENDIVIETTYEANSKPQCVIYQEKEPSVRHVIMGNLNEMGNLNVLKMLLTNGGEGGESDDNNNNNITEGGDDDDDENATDYESKEDVLWIKQVSRLENYEDETVSTAFSSFLDQYRQLHASSPSSTPSVFSNIVFDSGENSINEKEIEREEEIMYSQEELEALQNGEGIIKLDLQKSTQGKKKQTSWTGEGYLSTASEQMVYKGAFVNGKFDGKGVLFYKNGKKQYEGEFKANVLHGYGVWYFPNGCLHYTGYWDHGEMSGNGNLYRLLDMKYFNSIYRTYLFADGEHIDHVSFSDDFNYDSYVDSCPHSCVCFISANLSHNFIFHSCHECSNLLTV